MLKFAKNNPCIIYNDKCKNTSHVFACNCEQRILTGLVKEKNYIVKTFDTNETSSGIIDNGGHFFGIRHNMKNKTDNDDLGCYLEN
jgi:hypothetical protein